MTDFPTEPLTWGTETGGDILPGLVPVSATLVETGITPTGVIYGRVAYAFSGSPNLSGVLFGHALTVSGFANPENNGQGMPVHSADNTAKTITVQVTSRVDASKDESALVGGTAKVTTSGAQLQRPSSALQGRGYSAGQKPNSANENYWRNRVGNALTWLRENVDTDYAIQQRLTAGTNITLADNGDGTMLISGAAVTAVPLADAIGKTFTQASHGFVAGNAIRHNGTAWVKAQGNSLANATGVWLVVSTAGNDFLAIKSGRAAITGASFTPGAIYYLSSGTAGALTTTKPTGTASAPLNYYLPVFVAESATVIHVLGEGSPTIVASEAVRRYTGTNTGAITLATPGKIGVAYQHCADWAANDSDTINIALSVSGGVSTADSSYSVTIESVLSGSSNRQAHTISYIYVTDLAPAGTYTVTVSMTGTDSRGTQRLQLWAT